MIDLTDLLAATAGQLVGPARAAAFTSFCYDSRLAQPGQLFVAVRTERRDGHDFIGPALAAGAVGVLCQMEYTRSINHRGGPARDHGAACPLHRRIHR